MALMKCIECNKDMSDTLEACPHCGFKRVVSKEHVSNLKSMVKCDCGKVYSIYTKACPSCKKVNVNFKKTPAIKFAIIAIAVIIVGFAISKGFETNSKNISQNNANSNVNSNIASQNIVYKIGDRGPAGGWIFYDKGNSKGGWRYLEAAPEDMKGRINWSYGKFFKIGSTATNIGSGKQNTKKFLNLYGNRNSAIKLCFDYRGGGKSDWFLPSKDELNLMYKNLHKQGIGNFSNEVYWSSTEYNAERAWDQDFNNGSKEEGVKNLYDNPLSDMAEDSFVRAIRAF